MNATLPEPPPASTDPYRAMHDQLVTIHRALGAAFAEVIALDPADVARLVPATAGAGGFLLGHHHAETHVLFPALRRSGRLRSTDVAFLEGLDREHHALHALAERLVAEANAPHPRPAEILTMAKEVAAAFALHIRGEEAGLVPERLRTMIDLDGLAALAREQEAMRAAYLAQAR